MQLGSSFFFFSKHIFVAKNKAFYFGKATHLLTNVDAETLTVKCVARARVACGNH